LSLLFTQYPLHMAPFGAYKDPTTGTKFGVCVGWEGDEKSPSIYKSCEKRVCLDVLV
jgi:hypothetical protein